MLPGKLCKVCEICLALGRLSDYNTYARYINRALFLLTFWRKEGEIIFIRRFSHDTGYCEIPW